MQNRRIALILFVASVAAAAAVVARIAVPRTSFVQVMQTARVPHDRTVRVVAESALGLRLVTDGKRIVVAAGLYIYVPQDDGALHLAGDPASYLPIMGELEPLGGFATPKNALHEVVAAEKGALMTSYEWSEEADHLVGQTYRVGGKRPERVQTPELSALLEWRGGVVGIENKNGHATPWIGGGATLAMPEGAYPVLLAHGHADSLVAIGFATNKLSAFVWRTPATTKPVVIDMPEFAELGDCHIVPSFDGELYVASVKEKVVTLYVLDTDHWTKVTTPALEDAVASVATDGALYRTRHEGDRMVLERCARSTATCRELPIENGARAKPMAWFDTQAIDAGSPGRKRAWTGLSVGHSEDAPIGHDVKTLLARNDEDVWILSRSAEQGDALWHSSPARDRIRLPFGDEVTARNETAPTAWSGHCEEVFVVLAEAKDAIDPTHLDREKLAKIVSDPAKTYTSTLVQGRLFDKSVVGVVLAHQRPETKIDAMEKAASALVDAFAKNPVDRPRVTCTMPVLDRVL